MLPVTVAMCSKTCVPSSSSGAPPASSDGSRAQLGSCESTTQLLDPIDQTLSVVLVLDVAGVTIMEPLLGRLLTLALCWVLSKVTLFMSTFVNRSRPLQDTRCLDAI